MTSESLVELDDITHRYGATVALNGCRLDIRPGEIHGLVGENGSGKSTVVKLLSGIMQPTLGQVRVAGEAVALRSPAHAQRLGVHTVFQETLISDECSGLDNVFAGTDGIFRRAQSRKTEVRQASEVLEQLGVSASILTESPYRLSLAERQVLTLTRALVRPWKLLILDEATSALDLATRDRLFALIDDYRQQGRSVLFVSHRMDELEILIDRATVQRSGHTIGTVERAEASPTRLLAMMSGRSESEAAESSTARRTLAATGDAVMRMSGARLSDRGPTVDLEVRQGEILGVAGLDGHGGAELVETIAGVRRGGSAGAVTIREGERWSNVTSYRGAVRARIAYVPGKRQQEGLFPTLPVRDNLVMATLRRHVRGVGIFSPKSVMGSVETEMKRLAVVPDDPDYPITGLSGGNAQKVLVGRWLASGPRVLVLNDPLRGVDLGTKRDFYALMHELTDAGMTIVMLSTEIEELLIACDRVAVCHDHGVEALLEGEELHHEAVLAAMFGQSEKEFAAATAAERKGA